MLPFSGALLHFQHHGVHLYSHVFQRVGALTSWHKDCVLLNPVLLASFTLSFPTHSEGSIVSLNTIIGTINTVNGPESDHFLKLFLVQLFTAGCKNE